jgi:hypothetical protein
MNIGVKGAMPGVHAYGASGPYWPEPAHRACMESQGSPASKAWAMNVFGSFSLGMKPYPAVRGVCRCGVSVCRWE